MRIDFSLSIILSVLLLSCGMENKPVYNFTATASPEIGGTIVWPHPTESGKFDYDWSLFQAVVDSLRTI